MRIATTCLLVGSLAACYDAEDTPAATGSEEGSVAGVTAVEIGALPLFGREGVPLELAALPKDPMRPTRDGLEFLQVQVREDFRDGARNCLSRLNGKYGYFLLVSGDFHDTEKQTQWYESMRAKEAAYGVGAEEAACERELVKRALHVARGDLKTAIGNSDDLIQFFGDDPGLKEMGLNDDLSWDEATLAVWYEESVVAYWGLKQIDRQEAVKRLERWLGGEKK